MRQRLSLAVAVIHEPEMLILDEPTSGVDPVARDRFWELLVDLSRNRGVTIFVSTHFMNEAERCDRVCLMHAGRVLAQGRPRELARGAATRRTWKMHSSRYIEQASAGASRAAGSAATLPRLRRASSGPRERAPAGLQRRPPARAWSSARAWRFARDPVRLAFALLGPLLLMIVFGYGISFDVENLSYAVLDHDRTPESRAYLENFAGSRYFREQAAAARLRRRWSGACTAASSRSQSRFRPASAETSSAGASPEVGVWVDGANPFRAEVSRGYVEGVHQVYLAELARHDPAAGGDRSIAGDDRDALSLQPGLQERLRDGARHHHDAARYDPRDDDGARRSCARRSWARSPICT